MAATGQASQVNLARAANGQNMRKNKTDAYNAGLAYLMTMLTLGYTAIHYLS